MRKMPLQKHLKPSNTEVPKLSISQESVNFLQRADLDRIIQNHRLMCLYITLKGTHEDYKLIRSNLLVFEHTPQLCQTE